MFDFVALLLLSVIPATDTDTAANAPEQLSTPQAARIRRLNGTVVSCTARQVIEGSNARQGKWVIDSVPAAPTMPASDAYGFGVLINAYRALSGLNSLRYDPNLTAWASQNNAAQAQRGLGHHVRASAGAWQNSGVGYASVQAVFTGWRRSPGHNAAMLARVTSYGIDWTGQYWTLNLR